MMMMQLRYDALRVGGAILERHHAARIAHREELISTNV